MSERTDAAFEQRTIRILLEESERITQADLVVWPESAFLSEPHGTLLASVRAAVDRSGALLIAGGRQRSGAGWITAAWLFAPGEPPRILYVKRRLLPLAESVPPGLPPWIRRALGRLVPSLPMQPGSAAGTQAIGELRVEVSICFEAVFASGASDADLLINLVNDGWYDATPGAAQHLLLARWRAIESGRPLLRSAATGISAIIRSDGGIEAELRVGRRGVIASSFE